MLKLTKKLLLLILLISIKLAGAHAQSTQPDFIDWTHGDSPIYQSTPDSKIVGHRWWLYSRKDKHQISIRFDISIDGSQGAWFGDIRTQQRITWFDFHSMNSETKGQKVKVKNSFAAGPDAEKGVWKQAESTQAVQMLEFFMDWEELVKLKNGNTLMLRLLSVEKPKKEQKVNFQLKQFKQELLKMEKAIAKTKGGRKFILTKEQIGAMPIKNLPDRVRQDSAKGLSKAAKQLGLSVKQLDSFSLEQVRQKIIDKKKSDKKKAHQKIYDLQPKWLDMNVCPRPDVGFCKNIGKVAYEKRPLIGAPFKFGVIKGVVWRSKGSIIKIYGGSVEFNIEPEVSRASNAKYYYFVKSDKGNTSIVATDSVNLKSN